MLTTVDGEARRTAATDQSFRSLLAALEAQGELVRFTKPVHPERNMSAVEWKTYRELGKSSLFTSIEGHPGWSACSQILADRRKWAIGLGIREDDFLQQISRRIRQPISGDGGRCRRRAGEAGPADRGAGRPARSAGHEGIGA